MSGTIERTDRQGIAEISFFHPQSNSLPGDLLRKLASEIEKAGHDKTVKVIIVKSEGDRAFCAGASFDELVSITNLEQGQLFFSGFASVINAIRKSEKFVLARVQGKAVGGGVGIASAADLAYAHESASVKLSELAVGIGPFVVGPAVERKIGKAAFTELTINATEWKTAHWAKEKGLYGEVYSTLNALDEALNTLAEKLAASNPDAMLELKNIFWEGTDHWDVLLADRAAKSGRLVLSTFTKNAINAFKKRS